MSADSELPAGEPEIRDGKLFKEYLPPTPAFKGKATDCIVWIEEPGLTRSYIAASSVEGQPTAWTYHADESQRPGSPGGHDVTIRVAPIEETKR